MRTIVNKASIKNGGGCPLCGETTCPINNDAIKANSGQHQKIETHHINVTLQNIDTDDYVMAEDLTADMRKKIMAWYKKMLSDNKSIRNFQIKNSEIYPGEFDISYEVVKYISSYAIREPEGGNDIYIKSGGDTYMVLPDFNNL